MIQQPRDLSGAFHKAVAPELRAGIDALEATADKLDRAYGPGCDAVAVMDVEAGLGKLEEIAAFAAASAGAADA